MAERNSSMEQKGSQQASRGKGDKAKAVKRERAVTPSRASEETAEGRPATSEEQNAEPEVIARIQQRAYWLFEAGGFEHGHDLEHWLEAERQITGSSGRTEV